MNNPIRPVHSYRCYLFPTDMAPDQVEKRASNGTLETIRIKAPTADYASASAHAATGKSVYSVERIEEIKQ